MDVIGILEIILVAAVIISGIIKIVSWYSNYKKDPLSINDPAFKIMNNPPEVGKIPENDDINPEEKVEPIKGRKIYKI